MKVFLSLCSIILLLSCGGKGEQKKTSSDQNFDKPTDYPEGEKIYMGSCVACHQKDGTGLAGSFPPLANSDYLFEDIDRAIVIAAEGMEGEITVNGETYNTIMAPQGLSNTEVKDVMNYVLNSWGNDGGEITLDDVEAAVNK